MPPHDPPVVRPLSDRTIDGYVPPRPIFCPRPVVSLPVRVASRGGIDQITVSFVVDTGADVTMIPDSRARRLRLVGYDPAAVMTDAGTSFHGRLRGRWGQVHTRVGSRRLELPCFYFAEILPASGWFGGWLARFRRGAASEGPFVLGRAGVLTGGVSLLVEGGMVALSDQRFR